jgi:hypothetical protein
MVKEIKWCDSMDEEMKEYKKTETWKLVNFPVGKYVFRVKWVYKKNNRVEGRIQKHKEWLLVKGYKKNMEEIIMKPFLF